MPKILQMFKRRKRQKGRLKRALGLPDKLSPGNIIQFPQTTPEINEEYPDYEIINRWIKLADEMLGSPDRPHTDYDAGNSRQKA